MKPTNTEQLIAYIVSKLNGNIIKTTLMKFLYLADLHYVRKYYKQFTDLEYIFYKNGPWAHQFDTALDKIDGFEIKAAKQKKLIRNEEFTLYFKGTKPRFDLNNLPSEVIKIVDEILYIFKKPKSQKGKVLHDILEHVYKETKPMKYAIRNEPIDFSYEFMTPDEKKYIKTLNQDYFKSDTPKIVEGIKRPFSQADIYNFIQKRISLSEELLIEREETNEESLLF